MASDEHRLAGVTPRARLAASARLVALADPDVVDVRGPERAVAVAAAGGGYEVALKLVARMVPLEPLAERLRDRVRSVATADVPGAAVADVRITFVDLWSPEDEAAAALALAEAATAVDAATDDPPAAALPPSGATTPMGPAS